MALDIRERGLFFHATLRATEQVEVETHPWSYGVEVGRSKTGGAGRTLPSGLGTEVHLRTQRTCRRRHCLVRLRDGRVCGLQAEIAIDSLVHHVVELAGAERRPPFAVDLPVEIDVLCTAGQRLLRLGVVMLRGRRVRLLEIRPDHAACEQGESGCSENRLDEFHGRLRESVARTRFAKEKDQGN